MQITALRDDVLRVRVGPAGQLPEDASWAVLAEARQSAIPVTQETSSTAVGFTTAKLRVTVHRDPLALKVTDLAGHVIAENYPGRPIEYHGTSFRVYMKSPEDEHYFGLGDKPGPLDRRNEAFSDWNTDAFGWQESTDPIYKSIPYFITLRNGIAAGIFLDNTWRASFDFNKEYRDAYSFGAPNGPLDYYILYGPEPKQVVETWAWLTGKTPLPPLWALGYQQSRYSYYPESDVRRIAAKLRSERIPADVIWLDIDYQYKNRPFTVDPERFPHFEQMVQDLKAEHLKTVVITDLHIADVPNAGYKPYDEGKAGDHFVKNPDGSTYVGIVWPGKSVFPDFTQKQSREWWGTLYADFVKDGVAGFWNDMNEPAIFEVPSKTMPDDVVHRIEEPGFTTRTAAHLEIHNIFGMENSRGTYEGLLKLAPDKRPFVMTRASFAGGQRYAATWTGDNSSTWNHLRQTIPQLLNLGLSGFAMSGADVGGFAGSPQPELLTRWLEVAAFQPIDRDHTAKGTAPQEPWENGTPEDLEHPPALHRGALPADAVSVHNGGGDEPHRLADHAAAVSGFSRSDRQWYGRSDNTERVHAGPGPSGCPKPVSRRDGRLLRQFAASGLVRLLDRREGGGRDAAQGNRQQRRAASEFRRPTTWTRCRCLCARAPSCRSSRWSKARTKSRRDR